MSFARPLLIAMGIALLAACGSNSGTPRTSSSPTASHPPVSRLATLPKADFVGPITQVMYDSDISARLSPPRRGEKAGVSWESVYASLCGLPQINRCAGEPGPQVLIADVDSNAAAGKLHGQLMFILSASNQMCPPELGPVDHTAAPPRHDCTAISYVDAGTGHWVSSHYGPASIEIK